MHIGDFLFSQAVPARKRLLRLGLILRERFVYSGFPRTVCVLHYGSIHIQHSFPRRCKAHYYPKDSSSYSVVFDGEYANKQLFLTIATKVTDITRLLSTEHHKANVGLSYLLCGLENHLYELYEVERGLDGVDESGYCTAREHL